MSKELVMEILSDLPDRFSVEDFFEILYLRLKAQKALEGLENEDVQTIEELKKEILEWK